MKVTDMIRTSNITGVLSDSHYLYLVALKYFGSNLDLKK